MTDVPPGRASKLVGSDRVLAVLKELAAHPAGVGLDELARSVDSPKPTVHRALASLRRAGLAAQEGHGTYVLGDEFLRIAFEHHQARPEHVRIQPLLQRLTELFGETTHYAVLDGEDVVYRAKVDPPLGAVRLTSVVGGRNPAHLTAVGKLMLSQRLHTEQDVRSWAGDRQLVQRTSTSISTVAALHAELSRIRTLGYAVDDQENEPGVNCLALAVHFTAAHTPSGAVSVSALAYRTPLTSLVDRVPRMRDEIRSRHLDRSGGNNSAGAGADASAAPPDD